MCLSSCRQAHHPMGLFRTGPRTHQTCRPRAGSPRCLCGSNCCAPGRTGGARNRRAAARVARPRLRPPGCERKCAIGTSSTCATEASEASEGWVMPRSIWLMKPTDRPARSATVCSVSFSSRRRARRRTPRSGAAPLGATSVGATPVGTAPSRAATAEDWKPVFLVIVKILACHAAEVKIF